ncbi:MAG: undecaprenyl-diphosphate phosphatase [Marinilabiliaceae bacterium]|nr:undecaprenyl-diphosphate phosphatase [Marinilabiliaceae bacterium]
MNWIEALILGVLQGLTEFLPVSSSGHIELGKALLGVDIQENLTFTIVVHFATVCSTLVVFRKDIIQLFGGLFAIKWNNETQYISKLILSSVPVVIVGLLFESYIEQFFDGQLIIVGSMLIVTAVMLAFTFYAKSNNRDISYKDAFVIGLAQMIAVMPGISRSGATISTALLLKNKKSEAARFSFLMVLIPILGKVFLDLISGEMANEQTAILPLVVGFIAAFIFGLLACKAMIAIVSKSKLIYFAIYCFIIGVLTLVLS